VFQLQGERERERGRGWGGRERDSIRSCLCYALAPSVSDLGLNPKPRMLGEEVSVNGGWLSTIPIVGDSVGGGGGGGGGRERDFIRNQRCNDET